MRPMSRTHPVASLGNPGLRIMPIERVCTSNRPGSWAQSRSVLGDAIIATPRTRWSSAASHTANVPP